MAFDSETRDVWQLEFVKARASRIENTAGQKSAPAFGRLGFSAAVLIAAGVWLYSLLLTFFEPRHKIRDDKCVAAVYGEWSNRTRHVLNALAASGESLPILVLGRPRLRLRSLASLVEQKTGMRNTRVLRPFDKKSALQSLPEALRRIRLGLGIYAGAPTIPLRMLAGIIYRVFLGSASIVWWDKARMFPDVVIYGHTGLADSTLLEFAQQSGSARTIHWVHGISEGLNFTGRSSVALFQCEHDAKWHRSLGGYGQCRSIAATAPEACRGSQGWLVLTNLVHPMNTSFQMHGVHNELRLLRMVATAADTVGMERNAVIWKPHPLFQAVPEEARLEVEAEIRKLGLGTWDSNRPFEDARLFKVTLCTPSTAALDLLRLGVLPAILELQPVDPDSASGAFPLRAKDAHGLEQALKKIIGDGEYRALFAEAWVRIGPGRHGSLGEVARLWK